MQAATLAAANTILTLILGARNPPIGNAGAMPQPAPSQAWLPVLHVPPLIARRSIPEQATRGGGPPVVAGLPIAAT